MLRRAGDHVMQQPDALYVLASDETGWNPWARDATRILLAAYVEIVRELWPGHGFHKWMLRR